MGKHVDLSELSSKSQECSGPVTRSYISCACRCCPSSLDICESKSFYLNTIAFAASNALVLANISNDSTPQITHTFVQHTDKINAVRWIKSKTEDPIVITGSNDKTAIIWSEKERVLTQQFHLEGHRGPVTTVDGFRLECESKVVLYAVTGSIDSTIKIWKRVNDDALQEIKTIDLGNGVCLCARFSKLPNEETVLLAICLDDGKIHIYAETGENDFVKVESLIGHEDWVRDIDFVEIDGRLLIASGSQDTYVRIWSITLFENDADDTKDELKTEKKAFTVANKCWHVSIEAVLSGHEGWVYGVNWHYDEKSKHIMLLSSSFDKSLIIWEPIMDEEKEGVWTEKVRVGEVGGGGLGFYGGKFSSDGRSIVGHSYTGSFHIWNYNQPDDRWIPSVTFGGHFKEIVDLNWEPDGEYILTASTDQTARIHCSWKKSDESDKITFHEVARPQIHGYDMSCLAIVSRYQYVSGAEEKVIRVFAAPQNFITNFKSISRVDDATDVNDMPEGASVPSLGLSNKAVFSSDTPQPKTHVKDQYPENYFVPVTLKEPPTEEVLMQNTLWPETNKLYGHGYEVFSLAVSKDGMLLASACKSTNAHYAAILTWNTKTWLQIQTLLSHQLTVTQLEFSPDNLYLLSVSRDRRWSVFKRDDLNLTLLCSSNKENGVHTRIIWCCSWTPDSQHFVTGSRDGKIALWSKKLTDSTESFKNEIPTLELRSESVTALAIANQKHQNAFIMAAGFETGKINIYSLETENSSQPWKLLHEMSNSFAHHLTVRKLSFRPKNHKTSSSKMELASVSNDTMLKIYSIDIQTLIDKNN